MEAHTTLLVIGWTSLHIGGLMAAWVCRWHVEGLARSLSHSAFMASFLAIAASSLFLMASSFQLSLLSAVVLAVMAVGSVCESRRDTEDKVLTEVMAVYDPAAVPVG